MRLSFPHPLLVRSGHVESSVLLYLTLCAVTKIGTLYIHFVVRRTAVGYGNKIPISTTDLYEVLTYRLGGIISCKDKTSSWLFEEKSGHISTPSERLPKAGGKLCLEKNLNASKPSKQPKKV